MRWRLNDKRADAHRVHAREHNRRLSSSSLRSSAPPLLRSSAPPPPLLRLACLSPCSTWGTKTCSTPATITQHVRVLCHWFCDHGASSHSSYTKYVEQQRHVDRLGNSSNPYASLLAAWRRVKQGEREAEAQMVSSLLSSLYVASAVSGSDASATSLP